MLTASASSTRSSLPYIILQAQLKKHRSQLDIKMGSLSDPMRPHAEGQELKEVTKGPMFRKFFQGPGEEEDAAASQEAPVDLPDISPAELWSRVRAAPRLLSMSYSCQRKCCFNCMDYPPG